MSHLCLYVHLSQNEASRLFEYKYLPKIEQFAKINNTKLKIIKHLDYDITEQKKIYIMVMCLQ